MRQPGLFNFKPTTATRRSGFTPDEERALLIFCLSEDYPRTITISRTGTTYKLNNEMGAALLYKAIRKSGHTAIFGTKVYRDAKQKSLRNFWRQNT